MGGKAEGRTRLAFTRRAFRALPALNRPRVLDVGCGTGGPTLEIARLSDGEIVAMDIDQVALDELSREAKKAGLSDRITVLNRSMLDMDFADESFDLIWCEGAAYVIGFAEALERWRRFIRAAGFLVVHVAIWLRPNPPEDIASYWQRMHPTLRTTPDLTDEIERSGYELIDTIPVDYETWWLDYYGPLEERIRELRGERLDPELQDLIEDQEHEIDVYRRSSGWYGSAFFIMRKGKV